jgi:hypothetical protein
MIIAAFHTIYQILNKASSNENEIFLRINFSRVPYAAFLES